MTILQTAQAELRKHNVDTFVLKLYDVISPGCPHCEKFMYTISQFVEHLAEDVLPGILETAFSTVTRFVYCDRCKATVEYEKSVLQAPDGRTGIEIVCVRCHSPVCTFHDSKPAGTVEAEPKKATPNCPKCGMPMPCIADFDSINVLRCPECDALFERGQFVCYGAKPTSNLN
jgi:hypothetical protein